MRFSLPTKFISRRVIFRLISVLTFAIGVVIVWNGQTQPKPIPTRFLVQLPPEPRPLSELDAIPNVCGDLIVTLDTDNSLRLNRENVGNLRDTNELFDKLREIFSQRVEYGVYHPRLSNIQDLPEEERIYKRVIIAAPRSAKYGDVVRVC